MLHFTLKMGFNLLLVCIVNWCELVELSAVRHYRLISSGAGAHHSCFKREMGILAKGAGFSINRSNFKPPTPPPLFFTSLVSLSHILTDGVHTVTLPQKW